MKCFVAFRHYYTEGSATNHGMGHLGMGKKGHRNRLLVGGGGLVAVLAVTLLRPSALTLEAPVPGLRGLEILAALAAITLIQLRLGHAKRRALLMFRYLLTAALISWAAAGTLDLWLATRSDIGLGAELLRYGLTFGLYLGILLALEVGPHLRVAGSLGSPLWLAEASAPVVLTVGLFVYCALNLVAVGGGLIQSTDVPLALAIVVLGGYLVLRLQGLRWTTVGSWRTAYSWLLVAAALGLVKDTVYSAGELGLVSVPAVAVFVNAVWVLPMLAVVGAVMAMGPAAMRVPDDACEERRKDTPRQEGGGLLIVYALVLALLHFTLARSGLLDSQSLALREVWTLLLLFTFGGLAVVQQRLLRAENERLVEAEFRRGRTEHMTYHDSLTGLPNRLLFLEHVRPALPQAQRRKSKAAILFFNLDRFQAINDSLGRTAGDRLLRAVAKRMRALVRQEDTVARLGGDEFTVLTQGVHRAEDAAKVAQKLQSSIRVPFEIEGRELFITTSVGISIFPDDGEDGEALIKNADLAMCQAKARGQDGCQLYTASMNEEAERRLELEQDLHKALSEDQLVLHYQPIVDVETCGVRGGEALLRWQHPTMGLLSPAYFLDLAELTGLIVAIGPWVLNAACKEAKAWQVKNGRGLTVAVNLSTRQFREPDLVRQVEKALNRAGLDPSLLELEITESLAMENAEETIAALRELKKLGVRISIDDFGTGYSSLSYLKRLPIDTLKIDRSFVRDIHSSTEDQAIAAAVIALADVLGLGVVAEGVEREEQLHLLRQRGVQRGQGYYFSPPVPREDFSPLVAKLGGLG